MKILKLHMVQFFELSTGGPSNYTGKEISSDHKGHAHQQSGV